jgi:cytochrome P450
MEFFNPHSNEWLLHKFEIYKNLRNNPTAYWSEKYKLFVITRYSDVLYALQNPEIFSSASGNLIVESKHRFGRTLGASDNPIHDIYKNIAKNAYSKDNIQRIVDVFSERAKELLIQNDNLNISKIIEDLSATVTAELINPPYDKEKIKNYVMDIQHFSSRTVLNNTDNSTYDKFFNLLSNMADTLNVTATGPGIYKEYTNDSKKLKVMSLFTGPAISGTSSLTSALVMLTLDLYREGQLDTLLANKNLIPQAVNESLRFNASTGRFSRTVIKNVKMHGIELKEGDRVALCLESANRDPSIFLDPDKFDLTRNTNSHLAFGYGLHACIALAISKSIMIAWLEILLDNYGKYKVVTNNENLKYMITASGNNDMIFNLHLTPDK